MIYQNKLEKIEKKAAEIEMRLSQPDVAKDQDGFQKLSRELAGLRPLVAVFKRFKKVDAELKGLEQTLKEAEGDAEMKALVSDEMQSLSKEKTKLTSELEDLLLRESDPNANRDVIIEIRAGTGGEEAALFAADLFRMYSRFAAENGLKIDVMETNSTGKGGLKEVIFGVVGSGVYSSLKYESGIHRVQRVPETESSGRIHTSAVTVAVLAEVSEAEVDINPSDLRIDVFRASGAGGQHVNKTESAVRITHNPTGFVVSCQDERSQHKNKAKAMKVLRARLYDFMQEKERKEQARERKEQVGSGDRSGKIRTYNFPDNRVTDHRIGLTLHALGDILDGHLDPLVKALQQDEKERKLTDAA